MTTRFSSSCFLVAMAAIVVLTDPGLCMAQEGTAEALTAVGDRFPIKITYYAAPDNVKLKEAPVVVIVPDKDEKGRIAWDKGSAPRGETKTLPQALKNAGFAVITVDLRKQGESIIEGREEPIRPNDYRAMVLGDLEAVKDFIQEKHQDEKLNMRKMGIIGSGTGAALAAAFAEYDWKKPPYDDHAIRAQRTPRGQDVQALVLLSPKLRAGDAKTNTSMSFLRNPNFNIALMVIVGEEDSENYRAAKTIFSQFSSAKDTDERAVFLPRRMKNKGIGLVRQPLSVAYNPIIEFLKNQLQKREIEWVDRRSRLQRD